MDLGPQFEQMQLFSTGPSTPTYGPALPEERPATVEDRIKEDHPDAVKAVQRAPEGFKYKGPALYHGTSSDMGVGDVIYPTGVDLRPMGGSGSGFDLVGDVERHGIGVAYATPDYEDAAAYTAYQGGERGNAKADQQRLFHQVLQVEPLGKIRVRPYSNTGLDSLYGMHGVPHRGPGSEEVGSPHGFKVTGIAGYVANPEAMPVIKGESRQDAVDRMYLTPKVNSLQFSKTLVSGAPSWLHLYSKASTGKTVLEKEAEGRRIADTAYDNLFYKVDDKMRDNPNYKAPQKTYEKLNELYMKANPEEESHDSYLELHGEKAPWA